VVGGGVGEGQTGPLHHVSPPLFDFFFFEGQPCSFEHLLTQLSHLADYHLPDGRYSRLYWSWDTVRHEELLFAFPKRVLHVFLELLNFLRSIVAPGQHVALRLCSICGIMVIDNESHTVSP
jgi:hypothetical protein